MNYEWGWSKWYSHACIHALRKRIPVLLLGRVSSILSKRQRRKHDIGCANEIGDKLRNFTFFAHSIAGLSDEGKNWQMWFHLRFDSNKFIFSCKMLLHRALSTLADVVKSQSGNPKMRYQYTLLSIELARARNHSTMNYLWILLHRKRELSARVGAIVNCTFTVLQKSGLWCAYCMTWSMTTDVVHSLSFFLLAGIPSCTDTKITHHQLDPYKRSWSIQDP